MLVESEGEGRDKKGGNEKKVDQSSGAACRRPPPGRSEKARVGIEKMITLSNYTQSLLNDL